MPNDLIGRTLNLVVVLEDHHSLGVEILGQVLRLFTLKVLFEEIDLIVLFDTLFRVGYKVSSSVSIRKEGISHQLLLIFGDLEGLCGIVLLWPTADNVLHTAVRRSNSFCVDL